jgi:hypothetical protein
MPGLAVRDFECSLCQQHFTLLSGDLILPGPNICDACLREIWGLVGDVLVKHLTDCLAGEEETSLDNIVQYIKWYKEKYGSAAEAIRERERERGALE